MSSIGIGSMVSVKNGFKVIKKKDGRVINEWIIVEEGEIGQVVDVIKNMTVLGGGLFRVRFSGGIVEVRSNNLKRIEVEDDYLDKKVFDSIDTDKDPKRYDKFKDAEY